MIESLSSAYSGGGGSGEAECCGVELKVAWSLYIEVIGGSEMDRNNTYGAVTKHLGVTTCDGKLHFFS